MIETTKTKSNNIGKNSFPMRLTPKAIKLGAIIAIAILVIGLALYVNNLRQENQDLKANPEKVQAEEVDRVVGKVGELIALPAGTPSLATVEDVSKLEDQPFFQNAENGDFVLIFTESKQAILYREDDNKIINVAPLAIDETSQDVGTTPAE